jgi:hypothetical protein
MLFLARDYLSLISGLPGPDGLSRPLYYETTALFQPFTAPKFSFTALFTAPIKDVNSFLPQTKKGLNPTSQGAASFQINFFVLHFFTFSTSYF